jgi:hypothetical protein
MADGDDAEILEVVNRQSRQHPAVDLVVAERRLLLLQIEAPQPISDIHRAAACGLTLTMVPKRRIVPGKSGGRYGGRVWPVATPFGSDDYLRGTAARDAFRPETGVDVKRYVQPPRVNDEGKLRARSCC